MQSTIILLVIAYLLGSIPSGLWFGKIFFKIDIRQHGSGNIGTTNTYRVLGKKAGLVIMILDILKGSLATSIPIFFHIIIWNPNFTKLLFGLIAVLGHTCSIFDRFRGGKAVATSAGMLLVYNWPLFFFALFSWIFFISLTSMVSFASMITFVLVTILTFYVGDPFLIILAIVLTIFIFYRHRTNIIRIKDGNESMVKFGLGYLRRKKNHHQ